MDRPLIYFTSVFSLVSLVPPPPPSPPTLCCPEAASEVLSTRDPSPLGPARLSGEDLGRLRGNAEHGGGINPPPPTPSDKLTLGKMYVTSHQSQLITSLAAARLAAVPVWRHRWSDGMEGKKSPGEICIGEGFPQFSLLKFMR